MATTATPAQLASFRDELRAWLDAHLPSYRERITARRDPQATLQVRRDWQAEMAVGGWVGVHWPTEYGGRGVSFLEHVAYHTELAQAGAPDLIGRRGLSVTGPTLILHGSDWQRKRFLPPLLRADELWSTGFSEPEAGSDLASLRTRIDLNDDELVINGTKIWTSDAHFADWLLLLGRTSPGQDKHSGITCVLVPLNSTGITVTPIRKLHGGYGFNQVFLDDVRVPRDNIVGQPDDGWRVAKSSLAHEHYTLFMAAQHRFAGTLHHVIELSRTLRYDEHRLTSQVPAIRERIAREWAAACLIRAHGLRNTARVLESGEPGAEGSIMKLFGQEEEQKLYELCADLGSHHSIWDRGAPNAVEKGKWLFGFLGTRASTIGGGTSEMQRNVIAERVLGLPRDP